LHERFDRNSLTIKLAPHVSKIMHRGLLMPTLPEFSK
jgi:hypothetical protein